MKVGFLINQIDNRGTGNAVFDYAHFNERYLGNKSKIYTFAKGNHNAEMYNKYRERFGEISEPENFKDIEVLYHIKSGERDGVEQRVPDDVIYAVHAVFRTEVHGDRYAAVSKWMGQRDSIPYVPHYIEPPLQSSDLRVDLQIPKDATVFGRYGGWDTFDIPFVWEAIEETLEKRPDVFFIFANTSPEVKHKRIAYLPELHSLHSKAHFIATTDAMLHARQRGETFGISVAEWAVRNKPIITYANSPEKAHLFELHNKPHFEYSDGAELSRILGHFAPSKTWVDYRAYTEYTTMRVMDKFKEVFLDED